MLASIGAIPFKYKWKVRKGGLKYPFNQQPFFKIILHYGNRHILKKIQVLYSIIKLPFLPSHINFNAKDLERFHETSRPSFTVQMYEHVKLKKKENTSKFRLVKHFMDDTIYGVFCASVFF